MFFAASMLLSAALPYATGPCVVLVSVEVLGFSSAVGFSVSLTHYVILSLRAQAAHTRRTASDAARQLW